MFYVPSPHSDKPLLATAIYRDETHGSTSYEVVAGPKAFLIVWDQGPCEWTWGVNEAAELVLDSPIPTN